MSNQNRNTRPSGVQLGEYECPKCRKVLKKPKILPCEHTFCQECLKVRKPLPSLIAMCTLGSKYPTVKCPTCSKIHLLPTKIVMTTQSLPDNKLIQEKLNDLAGRPIRTLMNTKREGCVLSLTIDPKRDRLISGCQSGEIRIFEMESGECVRTLVGHKGNVNALVLSKFGQLVSGSSDLSIRIWDLENGGCLETLTDDIENDVRALVMSSKWKLIGATGQDVKLWDLNSGECSKSIKSHESFVERLVVNNRGQLISAGGFGDPVIKVWNIDSGSSIWKKCIKTLQGHSMGVTALANVSNDNQNRFVSGGEDGEIKVWCLDTGKCVRTIHDHKSGVCSLVVNARGDRIVSGHEDGKVKVWRVENGECAKTINAHTNCVMALLITNGDKLVSGSSDQTIKFWTYN
jgi:WD40 repeat protein